MEEGPVGTSSNLIDDIGFEIDVKGPGNMFSRAGFREEGGEAAIVLRWRPLDDATIGLGNGKFDAISIGFYRLLTLSPCSRV
jgi:hypothetical protein